MLLTDELTAFLESGVSIFLASRSVDNVPSVSRARGCHVSAERKTVRVFVAKDVAAHVLTDIKATGVVAATFSMPSTHETVQLKGVDAQIRAVSVDEGRHIDQHPASFREDVVSLGFTPEFLAEFSAPSAEGDVAVEFSPIEGALQTTSAPESAGVRARS